MFELGKHYEILAERTASNPRALIRLIQTIMTNVKILSIPKYEKYYPYAEERIHDESDVPFLALAIASGCPIWTNDKGFQEQDAVEIIPTKKMLELICEKQ